MNLCIDIGNSFVKLAVVENNVVLHKDVVKKIYVSHLKNIKQKFKVENAILGASGKIPKSLVHHLSNYFHLLLLDAETKLPIEISYETPKTLGRDRIAAVVGANALYPKEDNAVIDIGTCITYDVITKDKVYLGGNIAPGVELRLKSMNDYTARLPLVSRGDLDGFLGRSTKEALQNGATIGTLLEIESFIERVNSKFPAINTTLTGGDAIFFGNKINSKIFVNPNLVLIGLNEIMNFNV